MRRSNVVIAVVLSCVVLLVAFPLRPAVASAIATAESIVTCSREDACMKVINTGVGVGLVGSTEKLDGVRGEIHNGDGFPFSLAAGVAGVDTGDSLHATNGVSGLSNNGNGGYFRTLKGLNALIAESRNFNLQSEGHSTVLIMGPNNTVPELLMLSQGQTTGFPFADVDDVNGQIFYFTSAGDLHLKGHIYTGGSCSTGCLPIRDRAGETKTAYTPRQPSPTIEDVGQAELIAGEANVAIDLEFASAMDSRKPYLVFISADGPSKGLYVSQKTNNNFTVKENPGGRSTLVFDYRIVANPLDTSTPSRFGAPIPDRSQASPQLPKHAP